MVLLSDRHPVHERQELDFLAVPASRGLASDQRQESLRSRRLVHRLICADAQPHYWLGIDQRFLEALILAIYSLNLLILERDAMTAAHQLAVHTWNRHITVQYAGEMPFVVWQSVVLVFNASGQPLPSRAEVGSVAPDVIELWRCADVDNILIQTLVLLLHLTVHRIPLALPAVANHFLRLADRSVELRQLEHALLSLGVTDNSAPFVELLQLEIPLSPLAIFERHAEAVDLWANLLQFAKKHLVLSIRLITLLEALSTC